jgi:hypothetical protein
MKGAQELIWGLVRMGVLAAGVFYVIQVLIAYPKRESHERPAFDSNERLRSLERLLVWVGVMTVRIAGRLARPFVNMLSEASAEVGERAISRRQVQTALRLRAK